MFWPKKKFPGTLKPATILVPKVSKVLGFLLKLLGHIETCATVFHTVKILTPTLSARVGGWNKIKFLNFKFSMHMGVPWVYRNTFYFIGTPLFFKFCPYLGQKTSLQTVQKPKGGPLDEKIFFFKNCL